MQVKVELETTGLKAITQRELNWLTQFWTLSGKNQKDVTVYKDFNSPTLLVVVLALEWEPYSSQKSVKSTLIES